MSDEAVDEFLAHYGIKGMKWGTTHDNPTKDLRRINKKIHRINMNRAIDGISTAGYYRNKQFNKALSKDPKFSYNKLSKKDQKKYLNKSYNKAYRFAAVDTAVASAVIVGGLTLYAKNLGSSPQAIRGAQISGAILVGSHGLTSMANLHSGSKFERLDRERNEIYKTNPNLRPK